MKKQPENGCFFCGKKELGPDALCGLVQRRGAVRSAHGGQGDLRTAKRAGFGGGGGFLLFAADGQ